MRFLLSLLSLLALPAGAFAQHVDHHLVPDSAEVVEAVEGFHEALAARDSTAVDAMLLPEAVILESGNLETKKEYFGHHFGADAAFLENMDREIERRRVRIEEGAAWVSTTSHLSGTYNGESLDLDSAELMVLRETPEGWRVAAIHWSSRERE